MRGKRGAGEFPVAVCGLIPACAGKTVHDRVLDGVGEAHPRVCGENIARRQESQGQEGSSPRVRGKPDEGADL